MKKMLLIVFVLILFFVITYIIYLFFNSFVATNISSAMTTGKPTICTYVKELDNVVYMIDGRKSYTITIFDGGIAHVLRDLNYTYHWTGSEMKGIKVYTPVSELAISVNPNTEFRQNLLDRNYVEVCELGKFDKDTFAPPQEVIFTEVVAQY